MVEIRPLIHRFHYFKGHHLVLVVTLGSFLVCIPTVRGSWVNQYIPHGLPTSIGLIHEL